MGRVTLERAVARTYDLYVPGAGPAGCETAAVAPGLSVLLVDREQNMPGPALDISEIPERVPHKDDALIVRQGLGGTFDLWGGICVPMEAEDFRPRSGYLGGWPIDHATYAAWIASAADFLGVAPRFGTTHPDGWLQAPDLRLDRVDRLAGRALASALRARLLFSAGGLDPLLGVQGTSLVWDGDTVRGLQLRPSAHGDIRNVMAGAVVLTCGGLQVARMLLLEARGAPGRMTGTAWLDRGYIGHLTSSVATIRFAQPSATAALGYYHVRGAEPERRRLLVLSEIGVDATLWLYNLSMENLAHLSGELYTKRLLRNRRGNRIGRLRNVAADLAGAVRGVASGVYTRLRPIRHAERLAARPEAAYQLTYRAEHPPDQDSHVSLGETPAADGLPGLRVSFCYGEATSAGLVTVHRRLAARLQVDDFARIEMSGDDAVLARAIRTMGRNGYHQTGLTRMARDPAMGVVDPDARVHGTVNLFVASATIFPTASQTNPTLTVVALSLQHRTVRPEPMAAG